MNLPRGSVVWYDPGTTVGHEQAGVRPGVVVSPPDVIDSLRFRVVAVVPLTKRTDLGPRYPVIQSRSSGLRVASAALIDNVRAVDRQRLRRLIGQVLATEQTAIDEGLAWFLGLRLAP